MYETTIKRAIGAAIFAAILIVVVPKLFDSSGDLLTRDPPVISDHFGKSESELEQLSGNIYSKRENLKGEMYGQPRRDEAGRVLSEVELPTPIVEDYNQTKTVADKTSDAVTSDTRLTIGEMIDQNDSTQDTTPSSNATGKTTTIDKTQVATTSGDDEDKLGEFIHDNDFSGWVVQAGTFSQPVNAARLRAQLARVLTKDGVFVRKQTVEDTIYDAVFVGPYTDETKAKETVAIIAREFEIESFVRNLKSLQ